jgi:1-pyrroline-5-carboxylate dehydrogenase
MSFKNEMTFLNFKKQGRESEFHEKFEDAVEKVQGRLGRHLPMYIGGRGVKSGKEFEKRSPVDNRIVLAYLQLGNSSHVSDAVKAAKKAFDEWKALGYQERARIVLKAADIMSERKFEIAAMMTLDNGKNRLESVGDVDEAIDYLRYYAYEITRNKGYSRKIQGALEGEEVTSVMKPYGVWGVIPPFNFPLAITCGMTTGAIITGNTVVLKPASDAPMPSYDLYDIFEKAGLPPGVINLITGPGATTGQPLIEHPDVMGIAFTGSYAVGSKGYLDFSRNGPKPFISEMGGKNAAIVTSKADLDKAAEGVARGAFGFGGQKCSATSRVIVLKEVKKDFVKKLVEFSKKLKLGDPREREPFLGPVINEAAWLKYSRAVSDAKKAGKILMGGRRITQGKMKYGFYVEPTIVDGLPREHRLNMEELFVPFLTIIEAKDLKEAIEIANNVEYGLTGAIFSRDENEINKYFDEIEAGVVYANRTVGATTGAMVGVQPFVGWKHSGSTGKGAGGEFYLPLFLREQAQSRYS